MFMCPDHLTSLVFVDIHEDEDFFARRNVLAPVAPAGQLIVWDGSMPRITSMHIFFIRLLLEISDIGADPYENRGKKSDHTCLFGKGCGVSGHSEP